MVRAAASNAATMTTLAGVQTDAHPLGASSSLRLFAIDGALLGLFMVSACTFGIILGHPSSPVTRVVAEPLASRAIMGVAMGSTAIALIYSRWGRRSGAQMNPAVTLSHWRLGRLPWRSAAGYIAAQFVGGTAGVLLVKVVAGRLLRDPAVNFVTTQPSAYGIGWAWMGELIISGVLMFAVVIANRRPRLMRFTPCIAGLLIALYITFEAPISGMSMNPARTFSSAIVANAWSGWWIYFTAPPLGMLAAIELHRGVSRRRASLCGKFIHHPTSAIRCDCETA